MTPSVAPNPIGHYSQAVAAGGLLFLSGQISIDPKTNQLQLFDGDVVRQAELVLKNISAILAAKKLPREAIAKVTIFMTDLSQFAKVNEIYARFFGDHKPARTTVAVARLPKDVAIEIEAVAILR